MTDSAARKAIRKDERDSSNMEKRNFGQENYDLWWSYANDTRRTNWESQADEDEAFYHGKQFDQAEINLLKDRGQLALAINRVRPLLRHFVANMTAELPAFTAVGATNRDNRKSWLFQEYIAWTMYKYFFPKQFELCLKDMVRTGLGALIVDYDPTLDNLRGDVVIRRLHRKEVFFDPDAQAWDFSDSQNIIVSKVVTVQTAYNMWPAKQEQIDKAINQQLQHITDERNVGEDSTLSTYESLVLGQDWNVYRSSTIKVEKVRIIERYTRRPVPVIILVSRDTGKQVEFVDSRQMKRFLDRNPNEAFERVDITVPRIIRITSVLNEYMDGEILPLSEYPIVPFVVDDADNPFPVGEVRHLKDTQKAINKCMAIIIYAAQVSSNYKVMYEQGAIDSDERPLIEQNWALAGSWNEVMDIDKVKEIQGQPLSTAFYSILTMLIQHMEYEIGIFSMARGDPSQAPRTAEATQSLKEYGTEEISLVMRGVDMSLTRVGQTHVELTQANVREEKAIRIITDNDMVREERMKMLQERGLADENGYFAMNQQPRSAMAVSAGDDSFLEVDEDGELVRRFINDVTVGNYDVRVVPQSYRPTNRMVRMRQMLELADRGLVDQMAVLNETDIKDRDAIMQRMDMQRQLAQQLEGASEVIHRLETQLNRSQSQLAGTKVKAEVSKAQAELRVMVSEFKGQLDNLAAKRSLRADKMLNRMESLSMARTRRESEVEPAE